MRKAILILIIFTLNLQAEQHKIIKVIGANYFELETGEKVSAYGIKVEDTNKNIRWAVYNIVGLLYRVEPIYKSNDTTYCKLYKQYDNGEIDLALEIEKNLFDVTYISNIQSDSLTLEHPLLLQTNNELNYTYPNSLMMGATVYFTVQAVTSFVLVPKIEGSAKGFLVASGIISGIAAVMTYSFSNKKVILTPTSVSINIPMD